jgi:glycosyltransferase involved in cell wall biosynthesis
MITSKSKRILMLAAFAMDSHDAELIHFSSISNGLKKLGYDVYVYHISKKDTPAIKSLLCSNIKFYERFVKSKNNYTMFIKGILTFPFFLFFIFKIKPKIIYARLNIVTGIFIIATKLILRKNIKIVTENNGWMKHEIQSSKKSKLLVFIASNLQKWSNVFADGVRVVSEGIKSSLVSINVKKHKIKTIGNGTNIDYFQPQSLPVLYDFGFVGNLAKYQGVEVLIDSFALLLKNHPNTKLAIVGSGQEFINFKTKISTLNISNNVKLMGSIPYTKVSNFINSCNVCIAPKLNFMGSSLKIKDYAACGKAIISSRIPEMEEIEEAGFGILVEPGNVEELKNAMLSLLDNPEQIFKMGRKAREYAERNYSWDIIAQKISDLIIQPLLNDSMLKKSKSSGNL